jgi:hypothetical protein
MRKHPAHKERAQERKRCIKAKKTAWQQHDDGSWLCELRWGVSGRLYQARYVYDAAMVSQLTGEIPVSKAMHVVIGGVRVGAGADGHRVELGCDLLLLPCPAVAFVDVAVRSGAR